MANRQTRALRKVNLSTGVVKGASIPRDGKPGLGTSLVITAFPSTKGTTVDSSFASAAKARAEGKQTENKRKSPRRSTRSS
jgi:hypothetical protein